MKASKADTPVTLELTYEEARVLKWIAGMDHTIPDALDSARSLPHGHTWLSLHTFMRELYMSLDIVGVVAPGK